MHITLYADVHTINCLLIFIAVCVECFIYANVLILTKSGF